MTYAIKRTFLEKSCTQWDPTSNVLETYCQIDWTMKHEIILVWDKGFIFRFFLSFINRIGLAFIKYPIFLSTRAFSSIRLPPKTQTASLLERWIDEVRFELKTTAKMRNTGCCANWVFKTRHLRNLKIYSNFNLIHPVPYSIGKYQYFVCMGWREGQNVLCNISHDQKDDKIINSLHNDIQVDISNYHGYIAIYDKMHWLTREWYNALKSRKTPCLK